MVRHACPLIEVTEIITCLIFMAFLRFTPSILSILRTVSKNIYPFCNIMVRPIFLKLIVCSIHFVILYLLILITVIKLHFYASYPLIVRELLLINFVDYDGDISVKLQSL